MQKIIHIKFYFLFIFLIIGINSHAQRRAAQPLEIIEAENIHIPVYDFDGLETIFKQENDSIYIINFWATWCIPCVQELPYFEKLLAQYQQDKLSIKLVSLDFRNKVDKSLIPFLKKKNLQSEILLLDDSDANTWINKVDSSWTGAIPATVIYNKMHTKFYEKSFTFEELQTEYLKFKNQ